ncbi:zinc finger CCHC domain-containing protein 13-like [Coccinella septempunctata]|uniref:zinc finger CCHC domain-containing protein 13-like n=1 Tax=Coccinella septempunctata TaxID=41139 RepID=UPI001D07ADE0|nr:zinc finger CCHC domain-containing protein 13-like [Coccinella septempunctata]
MLAKKKLKIGFSVADIGERKTIIRCNRCWEEGHVARFCEGEDRGSKCRNCTKEGHIAKDCDGSPYCLICGKSGHRTATGKCADRKKSSYNSEREGHLREHITKDIL